MTTRRTATLSNVQSLARWALPLVATTLVACGGGEEELTEPLIPGPSSVAVEPPPPTPYSATDVSGNGANSGEEITGPLHYMVFDASGTTETAVAQIANVIGVASTQDIRFPNAVPFAGGLVISKALAAATAPTWNGIPGYGGVSNRPFPEGTDSRLLSQGNFFVYCSAGISYDLSFGTSDATKEPASRAGARVAISGNFVPMTNVAPLYGKTFNRFDCTNTAPTTKFGDDKGTLTMMLNGVTLSQADTVAAFSTAGYRPAGGGTYKRRAYQITLAGANPAVQYAIVALDTDAAGTSTTASVLYQYN